MPEIGDTRLVWGEQPMDGEHTYGYQGYLTVFEFREMGGGNHPPRYLCIAEIAQRAAAPVLRELQRRAVDQGLEPDATPNTGIDPVAYAAEPDFGFDEEPF